MPTLISEFGPSDSQPLIGSLAFPDLRISGSDAMEVIAFPSGTDETIVIGGVIDPIYQGGVINVDLHWLPATATTGDVVLGVQFKSLTTDVDNISKSFAAIQIVTTAAPGILGVHTVSRITLTNAQADLIAPGDYYRLAVTRQGSVGGDNMVGNLELLAGVVLE